MINIGRNEVFDFGNKFDNPWVSYGINSYKGREKSMKRYKEDQDVIHYISVKGCNYRSDLWDYIYLSIGGVVTIIVGIVILLV